MFAIRAKPHDEHISKGHLHFVAVYVDDIVIFSNTKEEHLEQVKVIINRLTRANTIAAPLDRLRDIKGNFRVDELELKCFEQLKHLITAAPVLSFSDSYQPFYVATDASNLGIGTVLYQLPNGPKDESKLIGKRHDFDMYRPGLLNVIPDALSRAFPDDLWASKSKDTSQNREHKQQVAAITTRSNTNPRATTPNTSELEATSTKMAEHLNNITVDPSAAYTHEIQYQTMLSDYGHTRATKRLTRNALIWPP
ncbi:hypothetical protein BGZ65_003679 [Modicella reniformis]|uniref:Reverse transcriptase/retrotransposon-derived protein RNase H-like domain-containing protein n=1 Tax=Modicella reniformis TaxID=1440133 RepID=A0A9P6LZP1_9FUNG|nr:hypothetical protein BGZ65_003679 [Modicella reniformis]